MIVLALFLLAVAIALVVVAVMNGGSTVSADVFDVGLDVPLWGIFLAGLVTGLISLGGMMTLVAGVRRSKERRREIEYLRRKVAQHEREADYDVTDVAPAPARDWIDQGTQHRSATPTAPATGGVWTPDPTR